MSAWRVDFAPNGRATESHWHDTEDAANAHAKTLGVGSLVWFDSETWPPATKTPRGTT